MLGVLITIKLEEATLFVEGIMLTGNKCLCVKHAEVCRNCKHCFLP
ncbi:hypothetical protein MSIBF_A3250002 [groundwater metagenome]|uniref:Uncharacterized protein n=1 Tax=groundwater metagenome TaxID=717931 RepID=A0A098EDJ4_9ZZZZ